MSFPWSVSLRVFTRIACTFALTATVLLSSRAPASAAACLLSASAVPVVQTATGSVQGRAVGNMDAYLGIPYAAPPVGALRWQPPHAHAAWSGTRAATAFANHCPQSASAVGVASLTEDCLYLNVFVPAHRRVGDKLPVMVWIHGGGFVDGESDDYDPDRLVARGVIVVTLNYRLGYFGFLATSGLDAEPHTHVNYGLLDQQFALGWTHANIAAFGGDPARTTVFGQSAGGASVFAQLLSPGSAGLFSRAIIQSGAYDILSLPTLASAETTGNALSVAAGCAPLNPACLRSLSVAQILAAQNLASAGTLPLVGGPSPAIDGTFIPTAPTVAFGLGAFHHVPIVQGSNHDEFRFFTATLFDLAGAPLTALEYPVAVQEALTAVGLGSFTKAVLLEYPLSSYLTPDLAFSALATDAIFSTPTYATDLLLSARTPVYAYEFSDESAPEDFLPPVSFPYGAAHGSELQFLYDSFTRTAPPLSTAERRLAATMVGEWTDFAARATPNDYCVPVWFAYSPLADDMQSLIAPTPKPFLGFALEHNVGFWAGLAAQGSLSSGTAQKSHYLTIDALRAAAQTLRPNARRF